MKCHYFYSKEYGKVHIPGCWGATIHGPGFCTCRDGLPDTFEEFEKQEYRKKLLTMKKQMSALEKDNAELNRTIKNLLKRKR